MASTYLVTGATGFIGAALTRALLEHGHRVRAFYRPGDTLKLIEDLGLTHFAADICDRVTLTKACEGCDGVFHTVGNMSFSRRRRPLQYRINVEGTRSVVAACLSGGVKRLVHTATVNTLGIPAPPGALGDEQTEFNWHSIDFHYAVTKKAGEEIALGANGAALQVVSVNPGTVFGPGDINFNAGSYIRTIAKSPVLFYPAGGANCVHVKAVVAGQIAAMAKGRAGERYILGGENLSYREIFTTIATVLKRPRPLFLMPNGLSLASASIIDSGARLLGRESRFTAEAVRAGRFYLYYSSAKAMRELGLPAIPFAQAVTDAVSWYRKTGML